MGKNTVEIDSDVFIDMLWDRVGEFKPARAFDDDFWTDCFAFLEEIGFMSDPQYNSPSYIVDNIAINGDICEYDECKDNYYAIDDDYDGDVDEWINDNGYSIWGNYVVVNMGL